MPHSGRRSERLSPAQLGRLWVRDHSQADRDRAARWSKAALAPSSAFSAASAADAAILADTGADPQFSDELVPLPRLGRTPSLTWPASASPALEREGFREGSEAEKLDAERTWRLPM